MDRENIPDRKIRWLPGLIGLALVLLAVWGLAAAGSDLQVTTWKTESGLPLTVIAPAGVDPATRPLVLNGHGFAGSEQVMRGFSFALAKAGYVVAAWDFAGHGANPNPLDSEQLIQDAELALLEATGRGLGDEEQVAILGHSMGSGVALSYGQKHSQTRATIAVSPVERSVTPELPRNLLLLAGQLEAPFVRNAEALLTQAGGAGGDPISGTARQMQVIPSVEHISILFAPAAHNASRQWLDAAFGAQPNAQPYRDLRLPLYVLGVLGALLIGTALAPLVAEERAVSQQAPNTQRWLISFAAGAVGASLLLWIISLLGVELRALLGLLVGGFLLLWFGAAGLLAWQLTGARPRMPSRRDVLGGLLAFAVLWLGVGLLGHFVWLPWLLIGPRLVLWPLGAALLLPWFLAHGQAMKGGGLARQAGWWLAQTMIVIASLLLALNLIPGLGFLTIILPLFPIVLGLHALASAPYRGGWAYALSGALFVSWILLAVFPLQ